MLTPPRACARCSPQVERYKRAAQAAKEAQAAQEAALKDREREEAKAAGARCGHTHPALTGYTDVRMGHAQTA